LPAEALRADEAGSYATGLVPLLRLGQWRDELRAAGVFVARRGEARVVEPAVAEPLRAVALT
jgi:hypothetical protein